MDSKFLVLDTSLFVNPDSGRFFGNDPTTAFRRFLEVADLTKGLSFLMPPSIYAELMHFAEESKISSKLLIRIQKQPPKKHEVKVPGALLYDLVESMRDRVDRGLRLAEKSVREALLSPVPVKSENPKDIRADAEAVSRLRDSYRRIMREGMLDSKADVDLLLLAYETNGILCSADVGVLEWANNLGIQILSHEQLRDFLVDHSS